MVLLWAAAAVPSCAGESQPVHAPRSSSIDLGAAPYASEAHTELLGEPVLNEADRRFLETAGALEIRHIALSRLALRRSLRDDVRGLAWRLAADHLQIDRELRTLARARETTLPSAQDESTQAAVKELVEIEPGAFDRRWLELVIADQRAGKQLFERQAQGGRDAGLREWAGRTLHTFESHIGEATKVASGLGVPIARGPAPPLRLAAMPDAPTPADCFVARAVPIYQGFGWSHFVDVASVCPLGLACGVATDVDPEPQYAISLAPWEVVRVRTRYGSNTDQFRPLVSCAFA